MSGKTPFLLNPDAVKKHDRNDSHQRRPRRQEEKVAKATGGRRQPGSGAFDTLKGDTSSDDFLVECKRSKGKKSIRLEAKWLVKIYSEAYADAKFPAIDIQFDESVIDEVARDSDKMPCDNDWIAVPLNVFQLLLEKANEGERK